MESVRLVLVRVLILAVALSHVPMNAAQQGQGGWGGGSGAAAGTWSSAGQQPGNSQVNYSFGAVDANGGLYGGYGGYRANITDEQKAREQFYYEGRQGGHEGINYGQAGQPAQQDYTGSHSYAGTTVQSRHAGLDNTYGNAYSNTNGQAKTNSLPSSSSAYASAWSTFYVICLFSLFFII